jgi:predicted phage terminase large subunit-like protein
MPSRLNRPDESAIICLQQRTHESDATGTLAEFGVGYDWVVVPMHFDPMRIHPVVLQRDEAGIPTQVWNDPRGLDDEGEELAGLYVDARGKTQLRPGSPMAQAEGELAWPERFSQDSCDKLRTTLGEYAYEGQFQQSPGVRGGGVIRRDWWQLWSSPEYPALGTIIASLDTALEESEHNDYNALTIWGAFAGLTGEPKLILIGAWRERMPLAKLHTRVAESCRRNNVDYLVIEKKTRGRDVHDEIVRLNVNATWQTLLWEPKGTKMSRLNAVSHLFSGDMRRDPVTGLEIYEHGAIYAPDKDWADEVINECATFPRAAHDDFVDSTTMALAFVRKNGVVIRRVEYEIEEDDAARYRRAPSVPYAI